MCITPMTQFSTPQMRPSRETLEFLRQFARSYRARPTINFYYMLVHDTYRSTLPN